MPNINDYLTQIETAVYGNQVRGAIHDAIAECYSDVTNGVTTANSAANNANTKASLAESKAVLAQTAAEVAQEAASTVTTFSPNAIDALLNETNSFINYDYDTPFTQVMDDDASGWRYKFGVIRDKTVITLNKDVLGVSSDVRIRLNGEVQFAANTSAVSEWTDGLSLKTGHTYLVRAKLLSGSCYKSTEGDGLMPDLYPYYAGTSTTGNVIMTNENGISTTCFKARENTTYNIALRFAPSSFIMDNAKILVTLTDVSDGHNTFNVYQDIRNNNSAFIDGYVSQINDWEYGSFVSSSGKIGGTSAWEGATWQVYDSRNYNDSTVMRHIVRPCTAGDTIRVYSAGGSTNGYPMFSIANSNGITLYDAPYGVSSYDYGEIAVTAPAGAAFVFVNCSKAFINPEDAYVIICKKEPIANRFGKRPTRDINPGEFFIWMNTLYKATQTIPAKTEIVPGTNCVATTVADELNALRALIT